MNIFPIGSLASSVVTTVWLGVLVVTFFNLRLGWVLSGLVVPGYLVPLLILKPWAAAVVLGEGLVTYLLVWLVSEVLSRRGWWSPFFGRDRFFALILFSILVRILCDLMLLPMLGEALNRHFGLQFDYRYHLHSFGLIIVALIANQFWKPGLRRGLLPFATILGLTYVLVRFGLMEWTNFTISTLGYLYEDVAFSILASPKSYIILLTAAFIASRMNLYYGWDFNGILIPSLLALQWYQPLKILTSFAEAAVILVLAALVLRTPLYRRASVEGARKLRLFFNIGFVYKMALGYLLLWLAPEVKVTDYYGFGYLLPTLMAVRMHDKEIVLRLTRATLQTSLVAVAAASLAGFCLTLLPAFWGPRASSVSVAAPPLVKLENERLSEVLKGEKVALYQARSQPPVAPLPREIDLFSAGIDRLLAYGQGRDPAQLDEARRLLAGANYQIQEIEGRLLLRETEPRRGWGVYVLNLAAPGALTIEVPAPLAEWGSLEGAAGLFAALNARALAVAGPSRPAASGADALEASQGLFQAFHRQVGRENALQVRGYTAASIRALSGVRAGDDVVEPPEPQTGLWVKSELPPGLDLARLERLVGGYGIHWGEPPLVNPQRLVSRTGFAELLIDRKGMRRLRFAAAVPERDLRVTEQHQRIDGYLQDWLLGGKEKIAPRGSGAYLPPRPEELLYLDEEVLAPLLRLAVSGRDFKAWSEADREELRSLADAAAAVGYQLVQYHHLGTGQDYLILAEDEAAAPQRFWGTYVLRLGSAQGFAVQNPRPLYELNSFEYAVSLFEELQARALLVGGTHPRANFDGSSDLVQERNKQSLFSLFNQALLRISADQPLLAVQVRAFGFRPGQPQLPADVLLAPASGASQADFLAPLERKLWENLRLEELDVALVDGSAATAGYEVGGNLQYLQLAMARNKEFALLWLSPLARAGYRQQDENRWQAGQFSALGIPTREVDLPRLLQQSRWAEGGGVPPELRRLLGAYLANQDIISLQRVARDWPSLRLERVIGLNSRQAFLLVHDAGGRILLVANLAPRNLERGFVLDKPEEAAATIASFIQTRAAWLEPGGGR